ncbi:MAG: hypothetical protein SFZ02_10305 [bacterium]|nr:hypothetical protein [bacterium]
MIDETIYKDIFGDDIILTQDTRDNILKKHPEVADFWDKIAQTLLSPDEIRRSIRDERVILYYRFDGQVLDGKWVVVVVKRVERRFISTIYATDQIKSGDILWKKTM